METQQQHKATAVALFLAALVLASPAAASTPGTAAGTPAEATRTEPAVWTPTAAGTPVVAGYTPAAATSTLAEATPTRETLQSKQC
jgi:hypothetical protein